MIYNSPNIRLYRRHSDFAYLASNASIDSRRFGDPNSIAGRQRYLLLFLCLQTSRTSITIAPTMSRYDMPSDRGSRLCLTCIWRVAPRRVRTAMSNSRYRRRHHILSLQATLATSSTKIVIQHFCGDNANASFAFS